MKEKKMLQREERVISADKATQLAVDFLKRYYSYVKPTKATKDNHMWIVEVDVGLFLTKIAKVYIDVNTARITEYNVPEAGELPGAKS